MKSRFIQVIANSVTQKFGMEIRYRRPARPLHSSRSEYQQHFVKFDIPEGYRVLDIGSGGDPFPHATVLAERFLEPSQHRIAPFKSDGRPVVLCDVQQLPFSSKSFDFVYCAHVLEHVDDPIQAAREVIRVGKGGYVETPHFMSDALFAWAKGMHKWFVQSIDNRLVFFEYDARRAEGIRSSAWHDVIFGSQYHPLQDVFAESKDIFAVMFLWDNSFAVDVYYCDGRLRHLECEE